MGWMDMSHWLSMLKFLINELFLLLVVNFLASHLLSRVDPTNKQTNQGET